MLLSHFICYKDLEDFLGYQIHCVDEKDNKNPKYDSFSFLIEPLLLFSIFTIPWFPLFNNIF